VVNPPATSEPPTSEGPPGDSVPDSSRRRPRLAALVAIVPVIVLAVIAIVIGTGSSSSGPAAGAAAIVPGDALAYVNLSLDRGRPAVKQALAVVARFPGFPLAEGVALTKLDAILSGGGSIDFATQVAPWLGDEAALALLNTTTSTAGSLIVLDVKDRSRAQAFVHSAGAVAHGSYRGTALLAYPSGSELAFIGNYLVLGQDASVRSAIDVAAKAAPSLDAAPAYRRAAATEPAGRVLDAYASLAGVRRLLAPQGGVVGALGDLLYQPALEGVAVSVSPTAGGARIQVHSALDPTLVHINSSTTAAFTPTLQTVMPTGSILMLDVSGLDRVAPEVLNAGSAAGVAGGIGPLLSRLGTALTSEGVNVAKIVAIFDREAAVAIVPHAQSPTLVIVARAPDQAQARSELAELEVPLAQLFQTHSKTSSSEPVFNDRQVGGVTIHQLALTTGLQLDYAVFRGLVAISTSLEGIEAVAQQADPLSRDPSFRFTLGNRPKLVTSLVFLDLDQLLTLGQQTGLTSSATYKALQPDLAKIRAIGLSSTRGATDSTAELSVQIP
jgi:hypothetical protein